jgi:hypothetical protein
LECADANPSLSWFPHTGGRTLRYVATIDDRWVALLGWQAAALHSRARDEWIGWPLSLLRQRLHLIANNGRFLLLPGESFPNLASRILALNLRRLSADWQAVYGHPIVLAETFVEAPRFTGTCYRAANWIDVGWTKGFSRNPGGKGYAYHAAMDPRLPSRHHRLCGLRPAPHRLVHSLSYR